MAKPLAQAAEEGAPHRSVLNAMVMVTTTTPMLKSSASAGAVRERATSIQTPAGTVRETELFIVPAALGRAGLWKMAVRFDVHRW